MSRTVTPVAKEVLQGLTRPDAELVVEAFLTGGHVSWTDHGARRNDWYVTGPTVRALERRGYIKLLVGDWRTQRRYCITDAGRTALARSRV